MRGDLNSMSILKIAKMFCRVVGTIISVEIELDAKVVIGWVSDSSCNNSVHFILMSDCMQLMRQIPTMKIKLYY